MGDPKVLHCGLLCTVSMISDDVANCHCRKRSVRADAVIVSCAIVAWSGLGARHPHEAVELVYA